MLFKKSELDKACAAPNHLVGIISRVRLLAVEHAQRITSSSVVSDDDMHKLPASRDERADGGHGSESLR